MNTGDIQPFQRKYRKSFDKKMRFHSSKPKVTLQLEDTFWSGKKALIPDLSVFKNIEEHALAAPSELRSTPKNLAKYLVQPAKNDLEKVRAIWWWVTHTISYDVSFLNHGTQAAVCPRDVLLTGKSICQGYGDLCHNLLRSVGVQSEVISGVSRSADYWPGCHRLDPDRKYTTAHAWNKVKLGDQWYLFDSTWGAGAARTRSDGMKEFNFEYREHWFLSDPERFMSRHLPIVGGYDDNNPKAKYQVQLDQQLIQKPQTSIEDWEEQTYEDPGNVIFGFRPESHQKSIIYTKDNEVKLTFTTEKTMQLCANFRPALRSEENVNYQNHVIIAHKKDGVIVMARAPRPGTYVLSILGYPVELDEALKFPANVMVRFVYTFVAEGEKCHLPFPEESTVCGSMPGFIQDDFEITEPEEPYIEAIDGKAMIRIRAPEENLAQLTAFLTTPDGETHQAEYIYMEIAKDRANIYVNCPTTGEHRILVQWHLAEEEIEAAAVFVIKCSYLKNFCDRYPKRAGRYGPQPQLREHGVHVVSPNSTTIIAPEGQCEVTFRLDHPMEYFCCIIDESEKQVERGQIYTEVHGDLVTLHTRIKTSGLYQLVMNFRERGDTSWGQLKAFFLLAVLTSCPLPQFPEYLSGGQAWWCDLDNDGLAYEGGYKSILHVHQSKFDLRFRVKPDVTILGRLFQGDVIFPPEMDGDVAVLQVTLPKPGEYILSIIKEVEEDTYTFVQHFLVNWALPTDSA